MAQPVAHLRVAVAADECLNINVFCSLTQARMVISDWKDEHNYHRRHSALGGQLVRPRKRQAMPTALTASYVRSLPAAASTMLSTK